VKSRVEMINTQLTFIFSGEIVGTLTATALSLELVAKRSFLPQWPRRAGATRGSGAEHTSRSAFGREAWQLDSRFDRQNTDSHQLRLNMSKMWHVCVAGPTPFA
jgi:hypothetical protein